jgi:MFS family permease
VVGRVYVVAVLAAGVGGLMLAPTTYTGRLAGLAFALLAVGTLGSTAMAFVAIRRRQIARHRVWMTRSYAFIFTGVSFRLGLMLLPTLGLSFEKAYAVSAWIAWPINLAVAEVLLRRRRRPSRRAAPDQLPPPAPTSTTDRVPTQPTAGLSKGGRNPHRRFLDHLHDAGQQSR